MKILAQNKKKLSVSIKIIKDTFQGFIDDNVMRLSASLAYATLFSIIPLLSLLVTIGVLLNIDFTNQLYAQLEPIVGSKVIDALQAIMENAETTDSFSFATIISIGVTIFGATTVFAEIQSSLNTIWGIKAVPKKSWLKYIINRLLSFSVILAFAFILLITFTITNLITDISNKFITNNPDIAESLVKTIGMIINIGVTTVIFTLIFKILPDAKIKRCNYRSTCHYRFIIDRTMGNILLYRICKYRNRIWSGGVYGYFHHMDLLFSHYHIYRSGIYESVGKRVRREDFPGGECRSNQSH